VLLGASRLGWRSDATLAPPWPRVVLAAGRKSVSAALWIRRRSAGRTRLVHVNRPWAPLSWFDLVVTTPQYAVPERPNVLTHLLPFLVPPPADGVPLPHAWQATAAALPRPWTVVLVGGNSRPYVLDAGAAARLGAAVNERVRAAGGSAWVLGSPRTPEAAMAAIERTLDVPSQLVRWGRGENPYAALRGQANRFIVTMDSASMLTEALLSGRAVTPFALAAQPDWRWRLAAAWRRAAERAPSSWAARSFDAAQDLGLLSSVRDIRRLHQAL
jgi:mitochondrial fission protein ELM1